MIHQTKSIQKIKKKKEKKNPNKLPYYTRQQNLQSVLLVDHYFIFIFFISQKKKIDYSGHYNTHTLTQQIGNIH